MQKSDPVIIGITIMVVIITVVEVRPSAVTVSGQ